MTPHRISPGELDPQLWMYRLIPQMPVQTPWEIAIGQKAVRLLLPPPLPKGMTREKISLGHGVTIYVFTPAQRGDGALLWIHGGGMVLGSAVHDFHRCQRLAEEVGITVVAVSYRLAPRNPFPTPLNGCLVAWRWLQANAPQRGIDPSRMGVGGQSAGGGLAAALSQRLHDAAQTDDSVFEPAAQMLFCPMLDDRTAANTDLDQINYYLWNNDSNRIGWSAYLGQQPGAPEVPEYSSPARRTDLSGLPPTWMGVGTIELFYEEDVRYAQALADAGVEVELSIVPGAPHAFELIASHTPLAREYLGEAHRWLKARLTPTKTAP